MTIIAASMLNNGLAQKLDYPVTNKVDHVDEYHGVKVSDPYRWLEDDRSKETGEWVKAQNEVTFSYLDKIPFRNKIFLDLEKAYNYPKYSAPRKKGDYYYFYKNDGLQNQAVLYRQEGENETPEIVIDPNKLSADGTTRLTVFSLSKDGNYAVMGFSQGGSDWQEYQVMDMKSLSMLSDKVEWVKISGAAWQDDGFYYSRYPKPEGSALAAKNENHQAYFHKIGTAQSEDRLIFEDPQNPQRFHTIGTTEDEQFAVLSVSDRGKGKDGNGLWVLKKGETTFTPIKEEITDFQYGVIENVGNDFLIETNENAPNSKVMRYVSASKTWETVLSEKPEPLLGAGVAGNKLFASYSKDVSSRAYVYSIDGTLENEVKLPGLGTASGFGGEREDSFVFYTYTSFNYPPTIFKYDIASQKSVVFREPEVTFKPEDYETEQVFYPSKDGTKIPAFITYKKGVKRDGSNPTILYGYGGFNISLTPGFSPTRIPFLDQGGIYVQANLRGGSEYGEKWHEQGMKLKKQNVFDDFIAAAEFLIKEKYTSASKLAIQGGSNGGLLVGTVMNQRPELFKVAFPAVGVMDMLRFHKFTIGWNWIADYGSSDNAEEFKVLYAYSPLHNIKEGGEYPATMITTADHDDRVVPAHSFKYAAELQAKAGKSSNNPLLIRIDTNSGHGASNTKKALETQADIYAFLFWNMGLVLK
ncbi:prolyl oligopeptidase family serine peptidase [Dyadobacter chenwenxiniae]|uniref:prolyl oligopeptidase n=1 Tax=Dyadobacter chenwenxiniae TaxID=2906456 RepID=A0A9X1PI80_9BACT|nr:prolyl oligopeptidase family serine peptidase [Dyadobacter chenwenxiniae]MCF0061283.1 prolyl oligopeptidase family serine peptidase [Dyadobacter chenwenxiniae]UON81105.1 prolyl oligopeptidase family serine peptidase [Dyadobacter chenwenxiniae]